MNRIKTGWMAAGVALAITAGSLAVVSTASIAAEMEMSTPATAEEHAAEVARYENEAKELDAKAKKHASLAASYRAHASGGNKQSGSLRSISKHCERLAEAYKTAASEAREMAKAHREMSTGS